MSGQAATEPNLITNLAEAMAEAGEVTKDAENKEQGYKYASAEAILAAVRGPLLKRGIILTVTPPEESAFEEREITARSGTKGALVTASLDFTFRDGTSELVIRRWRGQGIDYGDKAYGKAYTNAIKTFIRAQWLLPTGDDVERDNLDRGAGGAELPAWAREATDERKAELVNALESFLGRDVARGVGTAVRNTLGQVPDVVVATAKLIAAELAPAFEDKDLELLRDRIAKARADRAAKAQEEAAAVDEDPARQPTAEELERERQEAERREAERAQAAAEQGDEAPSGLAGDAGVTDPEEVPKGQPDKPPPGSVDKPAILEHGNATAKDKVDALRRAGCTCPEPLAHDDDTSHDAECPIKGHGIGF